MTASEGPGAVGWRFFLWWMLAFLGFPLGGLLALMAVGPVERAVSGALGGALAGAVIGVAQWLVLRRYLRVGPEWILATALGVAIGGAVGALLTGAGTGIVQTGATRDDLDALRVRGAVRCGSFRLRASLRRPRYAAQGGHRAYGAVVRAVTTASVWVGDLDLAGAIRSRLIVVEGPSRLRRAFPSWLSLSPLTEIKSAR